MKTIKLCLIGMLFMAVPTLTLAQTKPITGSWLYDNDIGIEMTLKATAKKGNNIHLPREVCHGFITVSEYYEYFMMLSLKLQKTVNSKEFIYTAWGEDMRTNNKKCRGTVSVKIVGNRILLSGKDSKGKAWPFNGYYLEGNQ